MAYKNISEVLVDATKFPAAIEGKLPAGAPKISAMLTDAAGKIPKVPDFPVEIPAMPAPPDLPEMPGAPELKRYVTGVEVTPSGAPGAKAVATKPEREKVPLVFE